MSFIKKLKDSSTLKIKYEGDFYTIPRHVLNIGRAITFESIGIGKEVVATGGKYPADIEKAAEECFQTFINEYLEASVPSPNPGGRHRAERAIEQFPALTGEKATFFQGIKAEKPGETPLMMSYVLKSGVFKIVDPFLRGVLKMKQSTREGADFKNVNPEDFGTNFVRGSGTKEAKAQIILNRYLQNITTIFVMSFVDRMYRTNGNDLRKAVDALLSGHTYGELVDKTFLSGILKNIAKNCEEEFSKLDLLKTVGSPTKKLE